MSSSTEDSGNDSSYNPKEEAVAKPTGGRAAKPTGGRAKIETRSKKRPAPSGDVPSADESEVLIFDAAFSRTASNFGEDHYKGDCERLNAANAALRSMLAQSENKTAQAERGQEHLRTACAQQRQLIEEYKFQQEDDKNARFECLQTPPIFQKLDNHIASNAKILDAMQAMMAYNPATESHCHHRHRCEENLPLSTSSNEYGDVIPIVGAWVVLPSHTEHMSADMTRFLATAMTQRGNMATGSRANPVKRTKLPLAHSEFSERNRRVTTALAAAFPCYRQCLEVLGGDLELLMHAPGGGLRGIETFLKEGPNQMYCGTSGSLFGPGFYAAWEAPKCMQYAEAQKKIDTNSWVSQNLPGCSPIGATHGESYPGGPRYWFFLIACFMGDVLYTNDNKDIYAMDRFNQPKPGCLKVNPESGYCFNTLVAEVCAHEGQHIRGQCKHGCFIKSYAEVVKQAQAMNDGSILVVAVIVLSKTGPVKDFS